MTQQYLAGELSLRLALLQDFATEQGFQRDAARLRKAAETGPLTSLSAVLARALALSDSLCWDSLDRGAGAAFISEATIAGELYEFGVCARLIDDGWGG